MVDPGLLNTALSGLAVASAAAVQRRMEAADQLASDSQRMWSIAMTTPTVMAGMGYRTMTESGASSTRAEANKPFGPGMGEASAPKQS
jgi:hypothetical protein